MLDADLADLYGVSTTRLNEQVRRNIGRFPDDFMFQLSQSEVADLISPFATSRWGGSRKPPLAFTELGVAMLSSVLRSERAIQVNISIMREFVRLRQMPSLRTKSEEVEGRLSQHNERFKVLEEIVLPLITVHQSSRKKIGFDPGKE